MSDFLISNLTHLDPAALTAFEHTTTELLLVAIIGITAILILK